MPRANIEALFQAPPVYELIKPKRLFEVAAFFNTPGITPGKTMEDPTLNTARSVSVKIILSLSSLMLQMFLKVSKNLFIANLR